MLNKEFFKKYKLPLILIGTDILLTLIYISTRGTIKLFNLDTENNIPTVYQTVKLLALSFFLYIFAKENIKEKTSKIVKLALYSFPIAFFFLALDEIGQIHENLKPQLVEILPFINDIYSLARSLGYNSADWVLLYSPAILFFGLMSLIFFKTVYKKLSKKRNLVLVTAFAILFSVPFIELYNISRGFAPLENILWLSIEEFSEMLSISLLLTVFYKEGSLKYD